LFLASTLAPRLRKLGLAARSHQGYRLKLQGWKAELQPGVDILDRNSLFDAMDKE
jgi:hypothetical protein